MNFVLMTEARDKWVTFEAESRTDLDRVLPAVAAHLWGMLNPHEIDQLITAAAAEGLRSKPRRSRARAASKLVEVEWVEETRK